MQAKQILIWSARFLALLILYYIFFIAGSLALSGMLPEAKSEPGLVTANTGLLIIGIANTLIVIALVRSSRWRGWQLALPLAFAYYGVVTFLMQIETWYFLYNITVGPALLPRLFLMGLPVAFIYIPLAVWILGKGRARNDIAPDPVAGMPAKEWAWRLALIAVAYVVLYWSAGYFIAWQNPELRAFYGSPGEIMPFWEHTANTLRKDPGLFPFQIFRAMLWTLCALPIIRGSRLSLGWTAVLVGLFFSVPQNVVHIIENPLMPLASVRLSHLIETASSSFVFGVLVVWILRQEHKSSL